MKRALFWGLSICVASLGIIICLVALVLVTLPDVTEMRGCLTTKMYEIKLCPKSNNYVRLNNISKHLQNAILVSEDITFYQHNGFTWNELINSIKTNIKRKKMARGGSTITQQLAKNVFLSGEKTLVRKFKEAVLTLQIEAAFSKQEIFERYLNVAEFGKNLFGVKSAAQYYFDKDPRDLTVVESAFLAHLLPNPVKYSTSFTKGELSAFSRKRVLQISRWLLQTNRISAEEMEQISKDINVYPFSSVKTIDEDLFEEDLLEAI